MKQFDILHGRYKTVYLGCNRLVYYIRSEVMRNFKILTPKTIEGNNLIFVNTISFNRND